MGISSISAENGEMSENVSLSTAPRREANSQGCRGTTKPITMLCLAPGCAMLGTLGGLGGSLGTLGTPLGPFGAQGGLLLRFWSISGSILGGQMVPKSDKKQGCFPWHILGPFLKDFEPILERILVTFRPFRPKIEK